MLERYCGACEEDYNQKVLSSQGAPPPKLMGNTVNYIFDIEIGSIQLFLKATPLSKPRLSAKIAEVTS